MPIYFLFGLKNGDMGPYLFFDPLDHGNTVLAYILRMVQDKVLVTIIHV